MLGLRLRSSRWIRTALTVALLATVMSSCGTAEPTRLTVLAAASLNDVFTTLGHRLEESEQDVEVRFSFAASSTIARQVVEGAPADAIATADEATMQIVVDADDADGTPTTFASNVLEIAVPPGNPAGIRRLADLADPDVKVVLCAAQVPCGAAAQRLLDAADVAVNPVTYGSDVTATLSQVRLGEVDAALVYRTDVMSAEGDVVGVPVPNADAARNNDVMCVLRDAAEPELARKFVDLVMSKSGRETLAAAGFALP